MPPNPVASLITRLMLHHDPDRKRGACFKEQKELAGIHRQEADDAYETRFYLEKLWHELGSKGGLCGYLP